MEGNPIYTTGQRIIEGAQSGAETVKQKIVIPFWAILDSVVSSKVVVALQIYIIYILARNGMRLL